VRDPPPPFLQHILHPCPAVLQSIEKYEGRLVEAPAVWRQAAVRDPLPRFLQHILHPCPAVLQTIEKYEGRLG
jgi:hypothetical protein